MLGPMQKAQKVARNLGRRVWLYSTPLSEARAAPFTVSDEEPAAMVFPCAVVEPDGTYRRREPTR